MREIKIRVIGDRPDVPEGWRIFNAPRPLYGHKEWTGQFFHGILYAAVDPAGDNAAISIRRNFELDAWELTGFITEDQAVAESYDRLKAEHPKEAGEISPADPEHRAWLRDSWISRERDRAGI